MSEIASLDGTKLFLRTWPADATAPRRGTLVLVHGYGEHIERYDRVAQAFAAQGWLVLGCDLRGHGRSAGVRGHVNRFDEYLDDVRVVVAEAQKHPGPLLMLGHSMGGLVATHYAIRHADELAGLVLTSPFYKIKLAVPFIKVLAGKIASFIYPKLALPTGLKGADVTRDPAIAALYDRDPLNGKNATARWFTESGDSQDALLTEAASLRLPVLTMHGGADKIADPAQTREVFARFGSKDKTLEILDGQYHEILNEPEADRAKTIARVLAWLNAHASSAAATAG